MNNGEAESSAAIEDSGGGGLLIDNIQRYTLMVLS